MAVDDSTAAELRSKCGACAYHECDECEAVRLKAADYIERLREELAKSRYTSRLLAEGRQKDRARMAILQEALETYAEPLNWSCLPCHDFTDWWTGDSNGYEVAQAALEKCRQPSGGSF